MDYARGELRPGTRAVAAAAFFVAAAAVMTYPLLPLAWDHVPFRIDPLFLTWTLDWELHQLFSHPLALFDANIFRPYHDTLAYSELALPDLLVFGPVEWLSGNPILAFNLSLFAVIAASGWTMYLLARRLVGTDLPAVGAGILFAFCQYRWGQYIHLQIMSALWVPLVVLFLDRYLAQRRPRDALLAAAAVVLQMLSSFYLGLFLVVEAGLFFVWWLLRSDRQALRRRDWGWMGASAAAGLIVLLPLTLPFFQVARDLGMVRSLRDIATGGAALNAFIRPAGSSLIYSRLLHLDQLSPAPSLTISEQSFFPGLVALALAGLGVYAYRHKHALAYLFLAVSAAVFTLGPFLQLRPDQPTPVPMPYLLLYWLVPGFRSIRLPARMGIFPFFWLAILVAFGLRWIGSRWPRAVPLALGLLLLDNLALPRPALPVPTGNAIPAVYRWLANQPQATIVELPIAPSRYDESTYEQLAGYEYFAIFHRHPSVVGYSSFTPPLYFELVDRMLKFPDQRSISFLQAEAVHYVVVHNGAMPAAEVKAIREKVALFADDLKLVGTWGQDDVYELRAPAAAAAPISARLALPSTAQPGQAYQAILELREPSEAAWLSEKPATAQVEARWTAASPGTSTAFADRQLVSLDLPLVAEQGVTYVPLRLSAPVAPGQYRLDVTSRSGDLTVTGSSSVQVQAGDGPPEQLRLEKASIEKPTYRPGDEVFAQLSWAGSPHRRLTEFLRLLDSDGRRWTTNDAEPFDGAVPTDAWATNTTVDEWRGLKLPLGLPPGRYRLEAGWYDAATGAPYAVAGPDGKPTEAIPAGQIEVLPVGPAPFPQTPVDGLPGWLGANLIPRDGRITAGQPAEVLLLTLPGAAPLQVSATLEGQSGQRVTGGQMVSAGSVDETVTAGEAFRQTLRLPETARLRGRYRVILHLGGHDVPAGQVEIASPDPAAEALQPPPAEFPIHASFAGGVDLVGVDVQPAAISLVWHPDAPIATRYKVFVHLLDRQGRIVAQHDGEPDEGRLPTTSWLPGRYVIDRHSLPQPIPSQATSIEVGLYDPASGQRLPVAAGGDPASNTVRLDLHH